MPAVLHSAAAVQGFHDPVTGTVSYLVACPATRRCAVIDPVLDFDLTSGRTGTACVDRLITAVQAGGLAVEWILETHAHADHLSAARHLQQRLGGPVARIAIGERIREVQQTFRKLYNLERNFLPDGSQFDHLFADGERFRIGALDAMAWLVPGHTPADMAYLVDGPEPKDRAVFVGDTLFMPDVGSARADFPGGDARQLYRSMRRLLALPPDTPIYVCHDYPPDGRAPIWRTTVAEQRAHNLHVRDGIDEAAFVAMRKARDATLEVPTLILPAMQINVRGGALPPAEDNGIRYLRIPIDALV